MLGSRSRQALTRLDLPAPEGAATMNRMPRAGLPLSARLLKVLHLLAKLFDQHLEIHRQLAGARIDRLRTQRIGFAVELLHQEIEAATDRLTAVEHATRFVDVGGQAIQPLVDIQLLEAQHQLLLYAARVDRRAELGEL